MQPLIDRSLPPPIIQDKIKLGELDMLRMRLRMEWEEKLPAAKYPGAVIGDFTYGKVQPLFYKKGGLTIGKFCSISRLRFFNTGDHRPDWVTTYPFSSFMPSYRSISGQRSGKGKVTIGNDVWIGMGVTIMSGVVVGDGAVLGANATVTKNIPPYELWAGNPAKFIKKRFSDDIIAKLLQIQWWNWSDQELLVAIPLLQSNNFSKLFEFWEKKTGAAG